MNTKHFALSKINWIGLVLVIQGLFGATEFGNFLQYFLGAGTSHVILEHGTIILGAVLMVLRSFFTNTTLTVKKSS